MPTIMKTAIPNFANRQSNVTMKATNRRLLAAAAGLLLLSCSAAFAVNLTLVVGLETFNPSTYSATVSGLTISNSMNAPFGCYYAYFGPTYGTALDLEIGGTYMLDVHRSTV